MVNGIESHINGQIAEKLFKNKDTLNINSIKEILHTRVRVEKIAIKDAKLRTFITEDNLRDDFVEHVYDVTYGIVKNYTDNLVVIDDSIVRGTTLKKSIIRILDRLHPKKIVIVSSAPQIRYPDCYGIDMAKLGDFIAFKATIELLRETGKESIINETYKKCKAQQLYPKEKIVNYVKEIYKPFTADEISAKISKMLKTNNVNAEVEIIFQTIENLHTAVPNDLGDWYFTGNYPTPGGNKVVNNSFINFIEGKNQRAY
jgi:amidophosphoribosyltransferase